MLTINNFVKGLNTDILPKHQPEGTYRFAMNAVLETSDGELPGISNELGNLACAENYPQGKIPIGHKLLDNEDVVLALYDPNGDHEIGIFNSSNCTYTTSYQEACLNFDLCYPVNILFKVRNGCERVIYFTDNKNEYRALNLTKPPEEGNCNLIAFNPKYKQMCINFPIGEGDLSIKDYGGALKIGVYYYFFRYLDNEQNPTDWLFGTRGVPIADKTYNYTFNVETHPVYNGGSNIVDSPYYVPPTTKSVRFTLNNLDFTNYRYYQIAVVKRTGDSGEIEGVDVLNPIEMPANSSTFIHTGYDSQVLFTSTVDEILSNKLPVSTVVAHAQLNNRLFVAAPTSTKYNYSAYQRYASKVKTEWTRTSSTSPVDTFNKQPKYYNKDGSFQEDEVYALAIVYVHEDGTESPPFHIPGRAPNVVTGNNGAIGVSGIANDAQPWDTGTLTTYGTVYTGMEPRWRQISTATLYGSGPVAGLMGYHEALTTTYPTIDTCDEYVDGYWGRDWQNNLIDNTVKLRHHRMPDTNVVQATGLIPEITRVGIRFSNVEYPPGVVRHFFVYSNEEPSIQAKGLMIPLSPTYAIDPTGVLSNKAWNHRTDSAGAYVYDPRRLRPERLEDTPGIGTPGNPVLTRTFAFISPENLVKKVEYNPRYIRVEKFLIDSTLAANPDYSFNELPIYENIEVYVPDLINGKQKARTVSLRTHIFNMTGWQQSDNTHQNYKPAFFGKIDASAKGSHTPNELSISAADDVIILNKSTHISPHIIHLDSVDDLYEYLTEGETYYDRLPFVSLKVDNDPYLALHNITYSRMSNCLLQAFSTATIFVSYEGDMFTCRVPVMDYSYRQGYDGDAETDEKYILGYFMQFSAHSKINYEFLHGANDPKYSRYNWDYQYETGLQSFKNFLANKYNETINDVMDVHPIAYAYNDSYSYMEPLRKYYPLPIFYDYCNDCLENSPYRIYYSELDNAEDSADGFRIIKLNNFRDLDGSSGPITDLFDNFGQLYAGTTNSLWQIPIQPQQLTTDESSIYIGTSEVLGVPPRQMKTSENAFGGYNFFKSRVATEYGTFYVDDITGRTFVLTDQLNDLSLQGNRNFWQNNGKISFMKQFYDLTGYRFTCKSTSSPYGVGYISVYDPRYKRIIVHKKDYKLKKQWETSLIYINDTIDDPVKFLTVGKLYYNNFKFYYKHPTYNEEIPLDNKLFFENRSFTKSYSFITQSWVSFHSYLPSYMFGVHDGFFSTNYNDYTNTVLDLYRHNSGPFTTYYDTKYPFVLDMIAINSPMEVKTTNNIFYTSTTSVLDPGTNTYVPMNTTFDKMIAYNENQTTGEVILVSKEFPYMVDNSTSTAFVDKTENQYRINNLRDISNANTAIWSTTWDALESSYFIDKVPNIDNIDYNKSMFEQKRLRDHYLGLRLFFKPEEDIKITTDVVATTFANRNR